MDKHKSPVSVKDELVKLIDNVFVKKSDLKNINLSTSDGFCIYSLSRNTIEIEDDKLAAIASTLCALSEATSDQLIGSSLATIIIETEAGHALFMSTQYLSHPAILSICVSTKTMLAEARFLTKRLSEQIAGLSK